MVCCNQNIETQVCKTVTRFCQGKCRSGQFLINPPKNLNQNASNDINYIIGQLNWPPYKQINVCLLNEQSAISLQNVFSLYFGF